MRHLLGGLGSRSVRVVFISTFVVLLVRGALTPYLGDHAALLPFTLAVAVSSVYGGLAGGVLAIGLSLIVAKFFIIPPPYAFEFAHRHDVVRAVLFLVTGLVISYLSDSLLRVNQRLERERRRMAAILNSDGAVVYEKDLAGRFTFVNKRFLEIFGVREEDVLGKDDTALHRGELTDAFRAHDREVISKRQLMEFEETVEQVDGMRIYLSMKFPLLDDQGTPYGLCGISTDITSHKHLEAELSKSLVQSDAIFESLSDYGVLLLSNEGIVERVNPGTEHVLGFTDEEIVGKHFSLIFTPEDNAKGAPAAELEGARLNGRASDDRWHVRSDGRLVWATGVVNRLSSGNGYVKLICDITYQKRAEERYRRSSDEQGALINAVRDHGIILLDTRGIVTRWSRGAERITGFLEGEVLTRHIAFLSPPESPSSELDDALRTAAQDARCELQGWRVRKDGTLFWANVHVNPIREAGGGAEGFVMVVRDLTERRAVERALKESEERFRGLADNIAQLAWMADRSGSIVWYNKKWFEFTGTTPEETKGWGWRKFHHPDHVSRVVEKFRRHIESGEQWEDTFPMRRADGVYRWFLSRANPIRDASGQVERWFGTNTDITEEREFAEERERLLERERAANAEAQAAIKMKDEFLAILSHELRTPLNACLGWCQLLQRDPNDTRRVKTGLEVIERNVRAQSRLISDLLDMSRITAGKMRLEFERMSLAEVVQSTVDTMMPSAEAKELRIHLSIPNRVADIRGDPVRLHQVVWNLLSNAIKFTPRGGEISLELRERSEWLVLSIKDSGEGIDQAALPFIFNKFQQEDPSTARRHGGLGLGLSLVQQLVKIHGGTVEAASDGKGRGATFTVTLPVSAQDAGEEAPPLKQTVAPAPTRRGRLSGATVLLVDDHEDTLLALRAFLEDSGARVISAASSREAVQLLEHETTPPTILLSDLAMPGEDGFRLIERVRELPPERGGGVPAVALTAFSDPYHQRRALALGFQEFMTKPVEPNRLLSVVERFVGNR